MTTTTAHSLRAGLARLAAGMRLRLKLEKRKRDDIRSDHQPSFPSFPKLGSSRLQGRLAAPYLHHSDPSSTKRCVFASWIRHDMMVATPQKTKELIQ